MAERKRQRLDGEGEGDVSAEEVANDDLQEALQQVNDLQTQLDKISEEATDRVLAIEQEYSQKRRPVYNERNAALQRIPHFWADVLAKHPSVGGMLTDDDIGVLRHCTELDVEDYEDIKKGFKITLTFEENPYFSNKQLSKSFTYAADGALTITGTLPDWTEEMAPPAEEEIINEMGKRSSQKDYRFMLWFMDEELPAGAHDELADIIRDDIWLSPVKYYQMEELVHDEGEGEAVYEDEEGVEVDEYGQGYEMIQGEGDELAEGEEVEIGEGEEGVEVVEVEGDEEVLGEGEEE